MLLGCFFGGERVNLLGCELDDDRGVAFMQFHGSGEEAMAGLRQHILKGLGDLLVVFDELTATLHLPSGECDRVYDRDGNMVILTPVPKRLMLEPIAPCQGSIISYPEGAPGAHVWNPILAGCRNPHDPPIHQHLAYDFRNGQHCTFHRLATLRRLFLIYYKAPWKAHGFR